MKKIAAYSSFFSLASFIQTVRHQLFHQFITHTKDITQSTNYFKKLRYFCTNIFIHTCISTRHLFKQSLECRNCSDLWLTWLVRTMSISISLSSHIVLVHYSQTNEGLVYTGDNINVLLFQSRVSRPPSRPCPERPPLGRLWHRRHRDNRRCVELKGPKGLQRRSAKEPKHEMFLR